MRLKTLQLKTIQIAAALGAAIAFLLAFMAAGALIISLVFALVGAGLVAWVSYGVARSLLIRRIGPRSAAGDAGALTPPTA